jgi:DNA polymerase III subunit delta'
MHFNTIPGLSEVKEHLISTVNQNKVAHAQLFAGPEGSPNLAMAIVFANFLACTNKQSTGSCGECPACKKSFKFIHPDIQFIFPVTGTKDIASKDALSIL